MLMTHDDRVTVAVGVKQAARLHGDKRVRSLMHCSPAKPREHVNLGIVQHITPDFQRPRVVRLPSDTLRDRGHHFSSATCQQRS